MPVDSYGSYKILTGSEGTGQCWWCGKPFPDNRARRFCSPTCRSKYQNNYYWTWAANNALSRARYCCQECGIKGKRRLHVHHIVPLKGSDRMVNLLNKSDNLVVLCKKCHQKRHKNGNTSSQSIRYTQDKLQLGTRKQTLDPVSSPDSPQSIRDGDEVAHTG